LRRFGTRTSASWCSAPCPAPSPWKGWQYFANPRNAFWPIAFDSFAQPLETEYGARLRFLLERGIGLWDAAASCQRRGSLDSAMRQVRLNDFAPLFAACPALKTVLCNGSKAFALFARAVRGRDLRARAL